MSSITFSGHRQRVNDGPMEIAVSRWKQNPSP
jgi:hypothetical protein